MKTTAIPARAWTPSLPARSGLRSQIVILESGRRIGFNADDK